MKLTLALIATLAAGTASAQSLADLNSLSLWQARGLSRQGHASADPYQPRSAIHIRSGYGQNLASTEDPNIRGVNNNDIGRMVYTAPPTAHGYAGFTGIFRDLADFVRGRQVVTFRDAETGELLDRQRFDACGKACNGNRREITTDFGGREVRSFTMTVRQRGGTVNGLGDGWSFLATHAEAGCLAQRQERNRQASRTQRSGQSRNGQDEPGRNRGAGRGNNEPRRN